MSEYRCDAQYMMRREGESKALDSALSAWLVALKTEPMHVSEGTDLSIVVYLQVSENQGPCNIYQKQRHFPSLIFIYPNAINMCRPGGLGKHNLVKSGL